MVFLTNPVIALKILTLMIVSPRRTKSFKWTVKIEHATLKGLKNSICAMYPTPALENDGAELNK